MDDLTGILENFFVPRYCIESYSDIFHGTNEDFRIAFPMVCFCDLPLSQINRHLAFYGGYGIGLRKEWGIEKKINPVLYVHQNSVLTCFISSLLKDLRKDSHRSKSDIHSLLNIVRHIKLYDGYVDVNGKREYRRFYDEREWRWVPFLTDEKNTDIFSLTEKEFSDPSRRQRADLEAAAKAKLEFMPDDIKYIIVSKENEIPVIMRCIEKMHHSCDPDTVKLLFTKIISAEQILEDF